MSTSDDGILRIARDGASADFALHGGELMSWRVAGRELVWHGDPAHWSRRAPILFPLVGASAGGQIRVGGQSYPMPQHGFARDSAFRLIERKASSLRLRLTDTDETRRRYPFAFALDVTAEIAPDTLSIRFTVENTGEREMPYALGFHPAFPWPFDAPDRDGHRVVFERTERTEVPDVVAGGLFARRTRPLPFDGRTLRLDPAMFTEALAFLEARSRSFAFEAPSGAAIAMTMDDFPHLAIWTRPDAPFLSLEAWTGHADWEDFAGDLAARASMRRLGPGQHSNHVVTLTWREPD